MGPGLLGWHLRACPKGGEAVGVTKRGKGSKVMLVTDGQGIPIGSLVASAQPAEIRLAEATLPAGADALAPVSRPWWPTRAMTAMPSGDILNDVAFALVSPADAINVGADGSRIFRPTAPAG